MSATNSENENQHPLKLGLSRIEAAKAIGVSPATLDRLAQRGLIHPCRATYRPIYWVKELERFLKENSIADYTRPETSTNGLPGHRAKRHGVGSHGKTGWWRKRRGLTRLVPAVSSLCDETASLGSGMVKRCGWFTGACPLRLLQNTSPTIRCSSGDKTPKQLWRVSNEPDSFDGGAVGGRGAPARRPPAKAPCRIPMPKFGHALWLKPLGFGASGGSLTNCQ